MDADRSRLASLDLSVGLSRIILGVHYLYDVLAGYLLGLGIGVGMWLLMAFDIIS